MERNKATHIPIDDAPNVTIIGTGVSKSKVIGKGELKERSSCPIGRTWMSFIQASISKCV
jgi:hypothetical protein